MWRTFLSLTRDAKVWIKSFKDEDARRDSLLQVLFRPLCSAFLLLNYRFAALNFPSHLLSHSCNPHLSL